MRLGYRIDRGWLRRVCVLAAGVLILAGTLSTNAAEPSGTTGPSQAPTDARRALPDDLAPSLEDAPDIRPQAYTDGCHAQAGDRKARACVYGVEDAPFSVLLIGDSHAVQWLPALEELAQRERWRLYSLTKSACPVPRTPVIVRGKRLRDCEAWRKAAFDRVADLHPDLVIAASLGRIYQVPRGTTPERRERLWRKAWVRSLTELRHGADRVVLLGDTPMWREDPIECLRRHPRDIDRCDTSRKDAISSSIEDTEREAAGDAGVTYVPTADLVCPGDPCRAVEDRYLVLGDIQHMTVAWARLVAPALLDRLACDPASSPPASPGPTASPSLTVSPAMSPAPPAASPMPSVAVSRAPASGPPLECPR